MRSASSLLLLPTSFLLSLLCSSSIAQANDLEWLYNLPPHVKYYPEQEAVMKRDLRIAQRLQQQPVHGVRKMEADPGQKFYLDYWTFEAESEGNNMDSWLNSSYINVFNLPMPLHSEQTPNYPKLFGRYIGLSKGYRGLLSKRDFVCPSGTSSCTSIDRPNTCCPSDQTCQIVPDTGLGDVGCCDASQTCAGSLSTCPSGYTSCPNNPGGGCCLPGYACYQEGCVLTSTTVVVVSPTSSTVLPPSTITTTATVVITPTSTDLPPSTTITTATVIVTPTVSSFVAPPATTVTTSVTSSETPTTQTITTSLTSTSVNTPACPTNFRSCPASLGGGCCPTDRACGPVTCPELSSSATLGAPVRPTTNTEMSSTSTSLPSGVTAGCPTGFYACSAYYQGGCCQVGRDCAQTSCPASASATVVNSNGVTAVAPTGTYLSGQTTLLTGSCATGWSSCAASVGGGCCPSGYACGTAVCAATASGGQTNEVGKIAPSSASCHADLANAMMVLYGISVFSMLAMFVL